MLSKYFTFETVWVFYVDPKILFAKVNWSGVKQLPSKFDHRDDHTG